MSKASVWARKIQAARGMEALAWIERPEPSTASYVPRAYTANNKPKPIPFADDIRKLKLVARWILNTFGEVGD